jgi:hypothetical protein
VPALLAVACGSTRTTTVTVTRAASPASPPATRWLYGRIHSADRSGDHYLLRFDPAILTSGITANAAAAAAEGRACRPEACPPVPNDNYTVDDGHELLVFRLPATVHGTVLARSGQNGGPFPARRIDGRTLATLVGNGKAPGITLFEPLDSGVWLEVRIDTVVSFRQQYHP